jgi:hypothetical protein
MRFMKALIASLLGARPPRNNNYHILGTPSSANILAVNQRRSPAYDKRARCPSQSPPQ